MNQKPVYVAFRDKNWNPPLNPSKKENSKTNNSTPS